MSLRQGCNILPFISAGLSRLSRDSARECAGACGAVLCITWEVRDPKQWWGGHIWADNAKRFIYAFVAYQTVSLWSNSNEYKLVEFRSFDDLLNPKLQSRIGISDPRTPAPALRCGPT